MIENSVLYAIPQRPWPVWALAGMKVVSVLPRWSL